MMKMRLIAMLALVAALPSLASAVTVASLDFTGGGSAWSVTTFDGGLPLVFELDGDPTNVGIATDNTNSGHYGLTQEVFAPVGFTMSNIVVTAKVSGFSSWVMDGRIGLHDSAEFALASDYSDNGASPSGVVNVDKPVTLDASGDLDYTGVSSVFINVEIVKGLASVWQANNVREIVVSADLTPIPEPASMALLGLGGVLVLARRKRVQ